jgi:hypothetical protein
LSSITPPSDKPVLFEWWELMTIALARGVVPAKRAAVAMRIAQDSRGTTGEDARVDDQRIALELGMHYVTVWRHVKALSEAGWLVRVSVAVGAAKGKPGRRAVYRLAIPTLDLMGKGLPTGGDNSESSSVTTPDDAALPPSTDLRLPTSVSKPDPRQEVAACGQTRSRSELVAEARAAIKPA